MLMFKRKFVGNRGWIFMYSHLMKCVERLENKVLLKFIHGPQGKPICEVMRSHANQSENNLFVRMNVGSCLSCYVTHNKTKLVVETKHINFVQDLTLTGFYVILFL